MKLSAEITPREQHYRDIFITAVEGGINSWFDFVHCDYDGSNDPHVDVGPDCHAVGFEDDGEEDPAPHTITLATIRKGMSILHKGGGFHATNPAPAWWIKKWRSAYRDCATGEWDFDATDADIVVQVGLLKEVVYG